MQAFEAATSVEAGCLSQPEMEEIKKRAFRAGVMAAAPSLTGIAAWGLVVGIAMIKSHLTVAQALGMTLIVFGGSAQLAALPLIVAAAPIWQSTPVDERADCLARAADLLEAARYKCRRADADGVRVDQI